MAPNMYIGIVPMASSPEPAPAPTITAIDPETGSLAGGETIVVSGTAFILVTSVTIDGVEVDYSVLDYTTIEAVTLPGEIGSVDVVVTTNTGTSNAFPFAYVAPAAPTLDSLSPSTGPAVGGQVVTLQGDDFIDVLTVTFDGDSIDFYVVGPTAIEIETPPNALSETVDVSVATDWGTSGTVEYTYDAPIPAPTLVSANPTSGTTAGGMTVTLTGTDFINVISVAMAGTFASFSVVNATTMTIVTPAYTAGTTDITVMTESGTSDPLEYTYVAPAPAPTLATITPDSGPETVGSVSAYALAVKDDDPYAYWRMGSTAADESDNGRLPTYSNLSFVTGALRYDTSTASQSNGSWDAGIIGPTLPSDFFASGGTIEFWANPSTYTASSRLFDIGNATYSSNQSDNIIFLRSGASAVGLLVFSGESQVLSLTSPNGVIAENEWALWTVTFGPTEVAIYKNGVEIASTAASLPPAVARQYVYFGRSPYHEVYNGKMDEIALYQSVLSDERILAHYNAEADPIVPTAEIVELIGTNFVSVQSVTFGGTPADFTVINNTRIEVSVPPHAAGQVNVVVTTATGSSAALQYTYLGEPEPASPYADEVLADSPYLYYRFSGLVPVDASGNGHTPVYGGGLAVEAGPSLVLGNAASFDGTDDFVHVPAGADMVVDGIISLEAWVYPTTVKSLGRIFDLGNDGPYDAVVLHLGTWNPAALYLVSLNNAAQGDTLVSPDVLIANTWTHVVGVITPTGKKIYVDGQLVASNAVGNTVRSVNRNTAYLGRSNFEVSNYFPGRLDEVAIYPYELTAARILAHYEAGT